MHTPRQYWKVIQSVGGRVNIDQAMPAQAALDFCVCVRETEAVIVKHQLVVQLLIKDVWEREEGEDKSGGGCAKTEKGKSQNLCRK